MKMASFGLRCVIWINHFLTDELTYKTKIRVHIDANACLATLKSDDKVRGYSVVDFATHAHRLFGRAAERVCVINCYSRHEWLSSGLWVVDGQNQQFCSERKSCSFASSPHIIPAVYRRLMLLCTPNYAALCFSEVGSGGYLGHFSSFLSYTREFLPQFANAICHRKWTHRKDILFESVI